MSPTGFHLTNVLLQGLCAALLWAFARRLGLTVLASTVGALVFALHPVGVEVVAWVAERKTLLAACFMLGAAAVLCLFALLTLLQSSHWRASRPLWSRAVEVEPLNPWVRQKLAYTLWEEGDARAALAHAKVAAALAPHWLEGLETLGRVALDAGEPRTAEAPFRQQIGIAPRAPTSAWIDPVRGDFIARTGRAEEAEELWRKILLARPGFEPARKRLSHAGETRGQRNELTGAAPSE